MTKKITLYLAIFVFLIISVSCEQKPTEESDDGGHGPRYDELRYDDLNTISCKYYTKKNGCITEVWVGNNKIPTVGPFKVRNISAGFEVYYKDSVGDVHALLTMEPVELIKSCH